jgi:methylenetetrahydrofolate dehydrogenase (NADP+)/methenyltetrahydrofolate cyclohydrolase
MCPELLKGKAVADNIIKEIKTEIENCRLNPKLALILIGYDPASAYYVQNIIKQCEKNGITVDLKKHDTMNQDQLTKLISDLNEDPTVNGIMLQKPLPKGIDENLINNLIHPEKDVDGFNPVNAGRLVLEQEAFNPCTAQSIIEIIKYYNIETSGKHVVVIGRSQIVGKPVANLLLNKNAQGNATVTVCHSRTENLAKYTKEADILIAAIGKANFITAEMIKENVIIIDAGINEITDESGKNSYVGDIDFNSCLPKSKAITPVPGGVGSVTTSVLLKHIVSSAKKMHFFNKKG